MANRKTTKYIVVHTTASAGNLTEARLRAMHKARGFSDIGYGAWIDRSGKVMKGRGVDKIGAHVAGFNSVSVGVAWDGGAKGNDITPAQEKALWALVAELCKRYPGAKVCGHRDLSPDGDGDGVVEPHEWTKTCPWFDAEVEAMNRGLPHTNFSGKAGGGGVAKQPVPEGPDKRTMWLQKLLRVAGYNVVADGWDGPKTKAAIEQFERDHKLPVTGSFDTRATVDMLKRAGERETPVTKTETVVREVVPAPVRKIVDDAAATDRVSTTNLTQYIEWGTQISGTGVLTLIGDKLHPYVFNGIIVGMVMAALGFGAYRIKERYRKMGEGQKAKEAMK